MRNKVLIAGSIAFLSYILGSRANQARAAKTESVGHQVVRLWNEPKAKKSRKKTARKLASAGRAKAKGASTAVGRKAHKLRKNLT